MALFSAATTNAIRTACQASVLLSPLPKHPTFCGKSRASTSLLVQNTLAVPKLNASKALPPQSVRFASAFFVDPTLIRLRREIAQFERTNSQGGACSSSCSVVLSAENLCWIFSASAALLMLLRNTAINKAFLVPLLALQAPRDVINWIRGEYGLWAAFLALLVRLFYYIPGELELPLVFTLLVITSPYQAIDFRGSTAATILCAGIAVYLAFQHFSRAGGLKGAFQEGAFLASLAIICLVSIPFIFLAQGF